MRTVKFNPTRPRQSMRRDRIGAAALVVLGTAMGVTLVAGPAATAAPGPSMKQVAPSPVRATDVPHGPDPYCIRFCGPFIFDLVPTVVLPPDFANQVRAQIAPGLQLRQDARRALDPVAVARYRAASTEAFSSAATLLRNASVSAGPATTQPLCATPTGRGPDRGTFERQLAAGLTGLGQAHLERDPVRAASLTATSERSLDAAAAIAAPCYA